MHKPVDTAAAKKIESTSGIRVRTSLRAGTVYEAFMTLAKSMADAKGEVQKQLAKFS